MRVFSALFAIIFLFSCSNAQKEETSVSASAATSSGALTTIQWIDTAKNIGKLVEGEKVEITYRFINTGNAPLVISSIGVSCGCTVPEKLEEPIAPGKEGMIKAVFDSKGRLGTNHKSLTVHANTEITEHPLSFSVEVVSANK